MLETIKKNPKLVALAVGALVVALGGWLGIPNLKDNVCGCPVVAAPVALPSPSAK